MAKCCKPQTDAKRLTARELVDRVTIESASDTHNANGSISRTWSTEFTRWGKIDATGGAEQDEFQEIQGHCSYRVSVPYDADFAGAVTTRHRVKHSDGRTFHIVRLYIDMAADRVVLVVNDYAPITVINGLGYSAASYDAILHNEEIEKAYTDHGEQTRRGIVALVKISEFAAGITALNETCTVYGKTYRIHDMKRAHRGDFYRLSLVDEFGLVTM